MQTILKAGGFLAALLVTTQAFADNQTFPAPEPGALPLVGLAIGVLALVLRRKK